jgi:hypothetical protein
MSVQLGDLRTLALMLTAATLGIGIAAWQHSLLTPPYRGADAATLVWIVFATPLALFLGWWIARPSEVALAAIVAFCIYFFTPFIAARYESCVIVHGSFDLVSCIVDTQRAQQLASQAGHRIYFEAVMVVHGCAAIVVAFLRARANQHRGTA